MKLFVDVFNSIAQLASGLSVFYHIRLRWSDW